MNDWYEILKGLSDVPLAVAAVCFGLLLWRRNRKAAGLLLCIAVEALLGVAAHAIARTAVVTAVLWTLLYPLLFETVRRFAVFLIGLIGSDTDGKGADSRLVQWVLCGAAVTAMWQKAPFDILFLAAFAAWQVGRVVWCGVRARRWPSSLTVLVALAAAVVLLQSGSAYIPYAVVAEHVLLLGALWWFYRLAAGKS